jgi:3-dehydrosphinganine reductase
MRAGAHITIFSRRRGPLLEATDEIVDACRDGNQQVDAVALDLSDSAKVSDIYHLRSIAMRYYVILK